MDNPASSRVVLRGLIASLLIASCVFLSGCSSVFDASWDWLSGGNDSPTEPQRIAVVCRGNASDAFSNPEIAASLAEALSRKIGDEWVWHEVVDQREINQWLDNNSWNGFLAIGRAVDADMIIAIDIENYSILDSVNTTLYRGTGDLRIQTIDCSSGRTMTELQLDDIAYPDEGPVQAGRMNSYQFSQLFVEDMSARIMLWDGLAGSRGSEIVSAEDDAVQR